MELTGETLRLEERDDIRLTGLIYKPVMSYHYSILIYGVLTDGKP